MTIRGFLLYAGSCLLCFGVGAAFAQSKSEGGMIYKTGNPADWPKEKDAIIAAKKNHKVLLENEKVRVLDVTLAPGEVEAVHSHRWPSVLYITAAGDFVDHDGAGNVIFDTRTLKVPLPVPLTMWKEPEAPHSVENLSKAPLHLVRVELKN
jgi:mannose-6-phosphate isomerase-like protein (cupin superfamily)